MYDFWLANQVAVYAWIALFIMLICAQFITRIIAASSKDSDIIGLHRSCFRWLWVLFAFVLFLNVVFILSTQSINLVPRDQEDRNPAELDQKRFENRVKNKVKQ